MSRVARIASVVGLVGAIHAAAPAADDLEFFESQVRPILVARCQECHFAPKAKGGLELDTRRAALKGGDSGPAIEPGKPEESLLIEAIGYDGVIQMPPKSKLPDAEIAILTQWVARGAPWPDDSNEARSTAARDFDLEARSRHWSFQPIQNGLPPTPRDVEWSWGPIDDFLRARLEAEGLEPAPDCAPEAWLRRLSFDLIGLPPTPEELDRFLHDLERAPRAACAAEVERLLASPRHGERWARHWLDLVRYAETAGHEFDYDLPGAWRYRDYVVRALNADLPYDRFVTEHLAGDLLRPTRTRPDGRAESILGTAFYFLGEGTHSPVDLLEDQAARIDNQIDVIGKAFLGLTIACARCHDHKFDPITARDYYALAGHLRSARPDHAFLFGPERDAAIVVELDRIKQDLIESAGRPAAPESIAPARADDAASAAFDDAASTVFEDFDGPDFEGWFASGPAFGAGPTRPGDVRVELGSPPRLVALPPGLAHSGRVSDRFQGVLRSRTFTIERPYLHVLAAGRLARVHVVIDQFEKIRAPIYGGLTFTPESPDALHWHTVDLTMWVGHRAYIELADGASLDYTGATTRYVPGDGFLAVDTIRFSDQARPPDGAPGPAPEAAPLLPERPDQAALIARFHEAEARIERPEFAPTVTTGTPEDAPLYVRGNPKNPGEIVPRRFLEVFGAVGDEPGSIARDRLELARRITSPSNPLTARVLVNRLWKHHFGQGLATSTDDFGAMGAPPTHPKLLDWLAAEFIRSGWSIKHMHRIMVLSHAYRMSSRPRPEAEPRDPDNRLLHRMNLRRLEAEPLRDAILALSGSLRQRMEGPSVPPHLTPFMEGRGRPAASGPLDGAGRRSLYLNVRRNFLSPFLLAFDFPAPASCVGRRNVSNVPAQALTLLNDPFVLEQSRAWATRVGGPGADLDAVIAALFVHALGRPPSAAEAAELRRFVTSPEAGPREDALASIFHVVINMKEFMFIE